LRRNEAGRVDWRASIDWFVDVNTAAVAVVGARSRVARVLTLHVELLRVVVVYVAVLVATLLVLRLIETGATALSRVSILMLCKIKKNTLKFDNFKFQF
jgi:hypothetical protein